MGILILLRHLHIHTETAPSFRDFIWLISQTALSFRDLILFLSPTAPVFHDIIRFILQTWEQMCQNNATHAKLPVPSHYLNQCWIIVNWTLWNKLQWNLHRNSNIYIQRNPFESVVCQTAAILSRPQCVTNRQTIFCQVCISNCQLKRYSEMFNFRGTLLYKRYYRPIDRIKCMHSFET